MSYEDHLPFTVYSACKRSTVMAPEDGEVTSSCACRPGLVSVRSTAMMCTPFNEFHGQSIPCLLSMRNARCNLPQDITCLLEEYETESGFEGVRVELLTDRPELCCASLSAFTRA